MNSTFSRTLLAFTALTALSLPAIAQDATPTAPKYSPVTNDMILNPPAKDWLMWRGTLDNQGYSPLNQVNTKNVGDLELAWAWPMASDGEQETGPLVHDGVMFLSTNDNIVQALNAKTGELLWEYRNPHPQLPASWGYQINQARRQKVSIALYEDKVILATVDAKLVALDAKTGKVDWQTQVYDSSKGYSYTVAPLVVNGKIISAISGCSISGTAGGCFITAHDVNTGKELWRFNTIDDPKNPEQEASWGGVPAENRWGGTPWTTGSYDAKTDTTFWGIGMPGPYSQLIRGSGDGDVLYTNNTVALNATTGERKWNYSHLPGDNWDLDSPYERVLVDTGTGSATKHLLVTVAGKDGIAFGLDRDTGKYLWSKDTVYQNVVKSIDPKTGKVTLNPDLIPKAVGQQVFTCPTVSGGKLWMAGAYSPLTHAFYVPVAESCNNVTPTVTEFTPGNAVGATTFGPRVLPEGVKNAGVVDALNVADGSQLWKYGQRPTFTSSLLTTGGGLVIGGDAGRYLLALDQTSGKVLWKTRLNAPIGGNPMTYEVDGEQYIAIPTGFSAQAASSAGEFPEIAVPSGSGNSIFVYKLRHKTTTASN
ncbi:MAG TPA: PQQ-binding-like beta-propeller repeat protein [Arsenicitalea sp.]|jgi:alcohol dehydrogenase (cytochrome c)|nr:PQQ-binding-like beta-propeller repeat protein [Arsenicitalea sp.]